MSIRIRALISCVLLSLIIPSVQAKSVDNTMGSAWYERISVLAGYMPGWAGDFASGEPDYHWAIAGLKFRFTDRVSFSAATAVFQNGNEWKGPDLWPFRYELNYAILNEQEWQIYLGPHLTQYAVTNLNDWIEVSGTDVFSAYGFCAGGTRLLGAGIKFHLQGSFNAEGKKEWKRQRPSQYYDPSNSITDFSGFNVLGGIEISF